MKMGQGEFKQRLNRNTVPDFKIDQYQGRWYEIARIDHIERASCQNAVADYYLSPDDTISVNNYCTSPGKATEKISGVGTIPDPNVPSKLKIDFRTSFGFSRQGDYWVVLTDYTSYALVSGGDPEYLWILSRKKQMSICRYRWLVEQAKNLGYRSELLKLDFNVLKDCESNDPKLA